MTSFEIVVYLQRYVGGNDKNVYTYLLLLFSNYLLVEVKKTSILEYFSVLLNWIPTSTSFWYLLKLPFNFFNNLLKLPFNFFNNLASVSRYYVIELVAYKQIVSEIDCYRVYPPTCILHNTNEFRTTSNS